MVFGIMLVIAVYMCILYFIGLMPYTVVIIVTLELQ